MDVTPAGGSGRVGVSPAPARPSPSSVTGRASNWESTRRRCAIGSTRPRLTAATGSVTTEEAARIAALERENRELRRATEILWTASAYFEPALESLH